MFRTALVTPSSRVEEFRRMCFLITVTVTNKYRDTVTLLWSLKRHNVNNRYLNKTEILLTYISTKTKWEYNGHTQNEYRLFGSLHMAEGMLGVVFFFFFVMLTTYVKS